MAEEHAVKEEASKALCSDWTPNCRCTYQALDRADAQITWFSCGKVMLKNSPDEARRKAGVGGEVNLYHCR